MDILIDNIIITQPHGNVKQIWEFFEKIKYESNTTALKLKTQPASAGWVDVRYSALLAITE